MRRLAPLGPFLVCLLLSIAFLVGRATADSRPIIQRPFTEQPVWAMYIVPPCHDYALDTLPIGTTWHLAAANIPGVMVEWPTTGLIIGKGYKHVNKDMTVCP